MTVKRSRSDEDFSSDYDHQVETTEAAANCLMLLSRVGNASTIDTALASSDSDYSDAAPLPSPSGRVFECKTCNKKFHSFQALGGHRASHKKLRLVAELLTQPSAPPPPKAAKKHECPICGLEFPLGQALGGHMRRHRVELLENQTRRINNNIKTPPSQAAVLKRSNSSKRVFGLDLNLTPFENDLKQGSPLLVHCFI